MPPIPIPPRDRDTPPDTPEKLYDQLTLTDKAIGGLWRHQSRALGEYFKAQQQVTDLALELPTGSGKTLVGLLIADWRRRTAGASSAFLCPTNQLASQAHQKAVGYGIPTVLLTGGGQSWDPSDETNGASGRSTIISTYSHIFNSNPRLSPQTIVFDDAHAAAGYVSGNWSIEIDRSEDAYSPTLELLGQDVPDGVLADLRNDGLNPAVRPTPILVGPAWAASRENEILAILDEHIAAGESASYPLGVVRANLSGCLIFLSWNEILIRPLVPPTRFHSSLEDAEQRVYLSATLGLAGELERSFGRKAIPRIAMPPDWERHGSGRRLVLVPSAGEEVPKATETTRTILNESDRALVLVPSNAWKETAKVFLPEDWQVLEWKDVDNKLEPFRRATNSALILANRYDGIDLPGDDCDMILLAGLPRGADLLERFLIETAGAETALRERIRTRLVQGMGRATRSQTDRAVVVLAGEDLVDFLRNPQNLAGLRAEIQAEIEYGIYLATESEDVLPIIQSFLGIEDAWKEAEKYLRQQADEANISPPEGADQLQVSASLEVLASEAAWRGDFGEAAGYGQAAVRQLSGRPVAAYRTFMKVLAANWSAQHARGTGDPLDLRVAAELSRDASASARTREWLPPLPTVDSPAELNEIDGRSVRIAELIMPLHRSKRVDKYINEVEKWVGSTESARYEQGLQRLGEILGFEAIRPGVQASPDSAWRDGDDHILWEAKSEQLVGGSISAKIGRQASSHHRWVQRELDWSAEGTSITYLVSPRQEVDPAAIAVTEDLVYLCDLDSTARLADEAADFWRSLVPRLPGLSSVEIAQLASNELATRNLTAEGIRRRLDGRQISTLPTESKTSKQ